MAKLEAGKSGSLKIGGEIEIQPPRLRLRQRFDYRQAVVKSICRNKRLKTCGSR